MVFLSKIPIDKQLIINYLIIMNKHLTYSDSLKNLSMILGLHLIFFITSFILIQNFEIIFSIPLFIIISLIHHKFLGEFIHEGCHYHLYKKKFLNDLISNYLIGIFFFVSVSNYRKKHFKHHEFKKYFKNDDPETGPLKISKKSDLWKNIFFDLSGINGFKFLLNYINLESGSRSNPKNSNFKLDNNFLVIFFIQTIIFIISVFYNFVIFYLVYYITLGTLYHLQLRFRIVCQHVYLNKKNKIQYDITTSRTIKGGLLEKLFFTSDITAYHNLHHKFPQYPFRKIKELTLNSKLLNDENIFATKRYNIIFNYYRSLL